MENNEEIINQPKQQETACCNSENKNQCTTKMLVISNIVLFVAVIVLFVLHFTSSPRSMVNTDAKAPVVAEGGLKVAYINTDSLNARYEYIKDLEKELQAFTANKENSYKQQMEKFRNDGIALQTEYQNYLKTGDQLTLSQQQAKEADFKKREEELNQRLQKLQGLEQELAAQVQKKQIEDNEHMIKAVYAFIREYNAANQQFNLIFARSGAASPVLYGDEAMDITDEIVKGLNEEYATVKKNKK